MQWPAMVVTVAASWLVGSQRKLKRNWGFWIFPAEQPALDRLGIL